MAATLAYGSTLEVETTAGSNTFTAIANITSVTKPNASVDEVETTTMESPNRAKQFEPGLTDYGSISYDINWNPSDATDVFIEAWRASGEVRAVRVTYGETTAEDTFPAFVSGYEAGASAPGEVLKGTLTLRVAGAVVRS